MNLLHICSYYIGNKLYSNLVKEISNYDIDQNIFVPVRDSEHIDKNKVSNNKVDNIDFYYANILNNLDRITFKSKINKQFNWVEEHILSKKNIDLIHAHTVFSDGATAYELYKKYDIDYVLNVRNTDINIFYKYGFHLRQLMYDILLNSKKIIFISYAYQNKMMKILPKHVLDRIISKFEVIPNGIEDYWHNNYFDNKEIIESKEIKLLFIGRLDKNKNLGSVIKACSKLSQNGYNCSLQVIGDGPLESKFKRLSKRLGLEEIVTFNGYIKDKSKVTEIMDRSNIFVMPSLTETFGLVYVEAMSRGLPIIYSKGEGIYGFFEEGEVGYSVNPTNIEDIYKKIIDISNRNNEISIRCKNEADFFRWNMISDCYFKLYKA